VNCEVIQNFPKNITIKTKNFNPKNYISQKKIIGIQYNYGILGYLIALHLRVSFLKVSVGRT